MKEEPPFKRDKHSSDRSEKGLKGRRGWADLEGSVFSLCTWDSSDSSFTVFAPLDLHGPWKNVLVLKPLIWCRAFLPYGQCLWSVLPFLYTHHVPLQKTALQDIWFKLSSFCCWVITPWTNHSLNLILHSEESLITPKTLRRESFLVLIPKVICLKIINWLVCNLSDLI